jgi:hypothetical protein
MGMGRTFLLAHPESTWQDWLSHSLKRRELVVLDPADAKHGPPGRLFRLQDERVVDWSFYGWLSPVRAVVPYLSAAIELLSQSAENAVVLGFPYRASPQQLELVQHLVRLSRADTLLFDEKLEIGFQTWPVGPELIELPAANQANIQAAVRKAQWLKFFSTCETHEAPLNQLDFQGARIGSGRPLKHEDRVRLGLAEALHGEICGNMLFLVSDQTLDELSIARALDFTHTHKAQVAHPNAYSRLICQLLDSYGHSLGMGFIEEIDFVSGMVRLSAAAAAPAPVQCIRLGGLIVSADGREIGERKLWEC